MQRTKPYILKLFFSNQYSYAQILRSSDGNILAAASTIEKDLRTELPSTSDKEASKVVGKRLAERAKAAGIDAVYWDRKHGQKYHGKIKELLQTMQAEGLPLN
ncbi:g12644 [Coccomyxa viridis]|uniref:G12644 protein n=1 Tax=Coccomyxa viridis TaxID=1274662 RepID=A0ABP1GF59_9CHLO